jgi:hypothetical protein
LDRSRRSLASILAGLRADPGRYDSLTRVWPCQSFEHDADHGEADEGGDGSRVAFEVAGEATIAADPGERAFDDPTFWQDDEAMRIAPLDDFYSPSTGGGDRPFHCSALIAGVGEDHGDEGKAAARLTQNLARAIAILHAGGMNDDAQEKAERIDKDVALATDDLLARVIALRVQSRAPF